MIKLVAFDWNGTLLADMQAVFKANNEVLKAFGSKPTTMKIVRARFTVPIIDYFETFGIDRKTLIKNTERDRTIFHSVYEAGAAKTRTRSNARQILRYLKEKNIDSIIFSNHVHDRIVHHIQRLKIENYFSAVLANSDGIAAYKGRNKEEKLAKYVKNNKLKFSEVLVVGDTTEEIEIAANLGCISIAITDGNVSTARLKKAGPDYLIHDLKKVIRIVDSLNSPNP
ncbi:MAG: HAD hydrolase-like protein [Candidatus Curtissbacteria bacterium]